MTIEVKATIMPKRKRMSLIDVRSKQEVCGFQARRGGKRCGQFWTLLIIPYHMIWCAAREVNASIFLSRDTSSLTVGGEDNEEGLMDDILRGLNPAQNAAVTSPAAVLQVLAPPGSGKTKTLTTRVAHMIAHNGMLPRNIIVCTFTVKAAKEMKDRICGFLGDELAGKLILGTFHSICRRYLSTFGRHIGLDEKFGIADTSDSTAIIGRIIKRRGYNIQPAQARSRISRLKAQSTGADEFLITQKKQVEQQEFGAVYLEYEEHLKVSNLLDYDDLLLRCADLLRSYPGCVDNIEAVLIDEFQDTNSVQYELMGLLAQRQNVITIVGDPDQSIYGWRSAEIKNLKKMQEQFQDTLVIKLEENYRSGGAILLTALQVIEQDTSRPAKPLTATHSIGMSPVLRSLPTAFVEAGWIVSEIQRSRVLTGGLLNFNDYAVLFRSASLTRPLESALGKAGIPYRMVGGHKFFDRLEVKLVLDYLRVVDHPDHNDAVARVINVPSRKVGETTVKGLLEEADRKKCTLWSLVLKIAQGNTRASTNVSSQAQKGIEVFVSIILTSQKKLVELATESTSLTSFLSFVVRKVGVEEYIKKTKPEEFEARWANVEELIAQASDSAALAANDDVALFTADQVVEEVEAPTSTMEETLSKFLANVALSAEVKKTEDEGHPHGQVTLSTIHAAKGLEWPVVFIPATYEGSIPHSRAEDTDEERRLLYVAMTRAQALLYLSCALKDSQGSKTELSKFLSPKDVRRMLAHHGPSFKFETAQELAKILRRSCPKRTDVMNAYANEAHKEDDQWRRLEDDGGSDAEGGIVEEREYSGFSRYKRARAEGWTGSTVATRPERRTVAMFSGTSTMQDQSTFSVSTASFVSAATLKITAIPETEQNTQARKPPATIRSASSISPNSAKDANGKRASTARASTNAGGQSSLMSYFAQPLTSTGDVEAAGTFAAAKQDVPLHDISNIPTKTSLVDGKIHANNEEIMAAGPPAQNVIKPGASLHATSMAMLRQPDAAPQRKTLGTRRAVAGGWAARMNR